MKNFRSLLSLVFVASLAGAALAELAQLPSFVPAQGEAFLALFVGVSLLLIAVADYSRPVRPLLPLTPLGRPALAGHRADSAAESRASRAA